MSTADFFGGKASVFRIGLRRVRRKAVCSTAAAFLMVVAQARADLVITQQVEGSGQTGDITIKVKGGKTRADLPQSVSLLTDAESGDTILLQHQKKKFSRISASQTKTMVERLQKTQSGAAPPKLEAGNQKQTINGYETELYTWSIGAIKLRFWVAKTYPNGAAISQQLDQLQNAGLASVAASMMPKPSELPGVRLKTEFEMPGQKVSYTITSIKEDPVDPSVFEIPKGYAESAVPLTGGGE